jgi:hypothetical protein
MQYPVTTFRIDRIRHRLIFDPTLTEMKPARQARGRNVRSKSECSAFLQFTPSIAASCVLHRTESRVILRQELYYFSPSFIIHSASNTTKVRVPLSRTVLYSINHLRYMLKEIYHMRLIQSEAIIRNRIGFCVFTLATGQDFE